MARKLPYSEGDVFAVALRDGGYGTGVVARMDGKGSVLGYFFGRRYDKPPELADVRSVRGLETYSSFGPTGSPSAPASTCSSLS